jgi:hypothetical protein
MGRDSLNKSNNSSVERKSTNEDHNHLDNNQTKTDTRKHSLNSKSQPPLKISPSASKDTKNT